MRTLRNVNMYVYLFRCMSHLGMLIRVTARAVLNIVNKEANIMDPVVLFVADRRRLPCDLCASHNLFAVTIFTVP